MKNKIFIIFLVSVVMLFAPVTVAYAEDSGTTEHIHDLVKTEAANPTCTENGNSDYWICTECAKIFADETGLSELTEIPIIPAVGHKYIDGICINCGSQLSWEFDELSGTLTIFNNDGTTAWRSSIDPSVIKNIEIKIGVTQIGDQAFMNCSGITNVTIPYGVTYLGHYSFYGCTALETISLPVGLEGMGYVMFNNCTMLRSVVIPSSVRTITLPMFEYCDSLEYVAYPEVLTIMIVPLDSVKLAYTDDGKGGIIITVKNNGGKESFYVPDEIEGKKVTKIINNEGGTVLHDHSGGTATCVETAVCSVCGQRYGELGDHVEDIGTIVKQPTSDEMGIRIFRCKNCGVELRQEVINRIEPVHTHNYSTVWKYDETKHWRECSCGDKIDISDHISDNGTVTPQSTHEESGQVKYRCIICGADMPAENEPYIYGRIDSSGWDNILKVILNASDKEKIIVNMNGTTLLPKEIIAAVSGRDIDLVLDMDNSFIWTINGLSVSKEQDVDMGVTKDSDVPSDVVNNFKKGVETIQIKLFHSGDLGFNAILSFSVGKEYDGMYANAYCYNSTDLKFESSCEITDGNVELLFTDASDRIIALENFPIVEDVSLGAGISDNGDYIFTQYLTAPRSDRRTYLLYDPFFAALIFISSVFFVVHYIKNK